MRESKKMERGMVTVNLLIPVESTMKENGENTRCLVKDDSFPRLVNYCMMGNGRMMIFMEEGLSLMKMSYIPNK